DDHRHAVQFPLGAEDSVALSDALLIDTKPVAVTLGVAKLQRVAGADIAGELFVLVVVEEEFESLARGQPEVVAAFWTDVEVSLDLFAVDDFFAVVALDP